MPTCPLCEEEASELFVTLVQGKKKRICEDCVELAEEQAELDEMSESAMKDMMGYKGSW